MLNFTCPKCKREDLEVVEKDITMTSLVVEIDENEYFEYDLIDTGGGHVVRFQCLECGHVLKDENDQVIKTEVEVVEWIRGNCGREAEE